MVDKVLLITGASSGIGEATARYAAQKGYSLFVTARRVERLERLCTEINSQGGKAVYDAADLTDLSQINAVVGNALDQYGKIDVLVNNAGFGRLKWLEQLDPLEDIARQIQLNLISVIQLTRAVLPRMIQNKGGHIINIDSVAGFIGIPTYSVYAASKFGLRGFNEALRREVGVYGIKVSSVYPGSVDTEFAENAGIERKSSIKTPAWLQLNAHQVGRSIINLIQHPKNQVIIPGYMTYAVWINQVFPGFVDQIMRIGFVQKEKQ